MDKTKQVQELNKRLVQYKAIIEFYIEKSRRLESRIRELEKRLNEVEESR